MALWKVEHGTTRKFVVDDPMRFLDLVALLALAASPGLLLVSLIPLPLVLPALSILSFVVACGVALFAHFSKVSRHEHSIALLGDLLRVRVRLGRRRHDEQSPGR